MKTLRPLLALVTALASLATHAETLITPAAAYAENYYEEARRPARAIDGSGLSADGTTHSDNRNDTWMGNNSNGAGGTFPRWYIVDLGSEVFLSSVKIWNFNMKDYTKRGVKDADIFVSSELTPNLTAPTFMTPEANTEWNLVRENLTFPQASGKPTYTGMDPISLGGVRARWFAIRIHSLHDAYPAYGGLSEIRFYAVDTDAIELLFIQPDSPTSASLQGNVATLLPEATIPLSLCYGTAPGSDTPDSWQSVLPLGSFSSGLLNATLPNLAPDTAYHAALCTPSGDSFVWSSTLSFSTGAITIDPIADLYESSLTPATLTFHRPATCAANPLTLYYTLGGTATNGTHYTALPLSVTFPAGEATTTLTVAPIDDYKANNPRTFSLSINPGPYLCTTASSVSFSILDDESDRVTCAWTGTDPSNLWSSPDNWSTGTVPRPIDHATFYNIASPTVILDTPASVYSIRTGSTTSTPHFDIGADLNVRNSWVIGISHSAHGTVDHHDGSVTISETLQLGESACNRVTYDLHGPNASLTTKNLYTNRYRSESTNNLSYSTIIVRDGATLNASFCSLTSEGAGNNKPPSYTDFYLLDGATATFGTLNFAEGGVGHFIASNATFTANTLLARASSYNGQFPAVDLYNGATAHINSIAYCQYTSSNERMTQWPGSTVYAGSLSLAGTGQGGTGTATDILYEIMGGSLTVTNASTIGNNGIAELRLEGGSATFLNNLGIDALRDLTSTVTTTNDLGEISTHTIVTKEYSPSILRLAGNATLDIRGELTLHTKTRGGRIAVDLIGGNFTATAKKLASKHTNPVRMSLRPTLTSTGVAPLTITESINLKTPLFIEPSVTEDALLGTYPILTWGTTLTAPETPFVLAPDEADLTTYRLLQTPNALYLRASAPTTLILVQ